MELVCKLIKLIGRGLLGKKKAVVAYSFLMQYSWLFGLEQIPNLIGVACLCFLFMSGCLLCNV